MLRKPRPGEYYGAPEVPYEDVAFQGDYPNIHEYLTVERWADGSPRTTSTLTLFVSGGSLKVVLNDRDNNRSAFINDSSVVAALEKLEAQLKSESVDWKSKGSSNGAGKPPF